MQSRPTDRELKYPDGLTNSAQGEQGEVEAEARVQQLQISGGPFIRPLLVSVEQLENGQVLVSDELLNCYGVGDDEQEAVEELAEMLFDHHADLAESRRELSSYLRQQLNVLDYFLGPRC